MRATPAGRKLCRYQPGSKYYTEKEKILFGFDKQIQRFESNVCRKSCDK